MGVRPGPIRARPNTHFPGHVGACSNRTELPLLNRIHPSPPAPPGLSTEVLGKKAVCLCEPRDCLYDRAAESS